MDQSRDIPEFSWSRASSSLRLRGMAALPVLLLRLRLLLERLAAASATHHRHEEEGNDVEIYDAPPHLLDADGDRGDDQMAATLADLRDMVALGTLQANLMVRTMDWNDLVGLSGQGHLGFWLMHRSLQLPRESRSLQFRIGSITGHEHAFRCE